MILDDYLFNNQTRDMYFEKLKNITADTQPQWGKLNPPDLMRHLRFTFDLSLGKEKAEDMSNFFTRGILRLMVFHWFTNWPKGKIKAPEYFTPAAESDFETEQDQMFESAEAYLNALKTNPGEKHLSPLLGPIPISYWSRVHGVHVRHHLRQFDAWE